MLFHMTLRSVSEDSHDTMGIKLDVKPYSEHLSKSHYQNRSSYQVWLAEGSLWHCLVLSFAILLMKYRGCLLTLQITSD